MTTAFVVVVVTDLLLIQGLVYKDAYTNRFGGNSKCPSEGSKSIEELWR
jgi:hypothetical protein